MRTRTIMFLLIMLITTSVFAQDNKWCWPASPPYDQCYIGRKYNYLFCVGNRLVEECTEFPNDQPWPVRPLKIGPNFFCVEFVGFYPPQLGYEVKMPYRYNSSTEISVWQNGFEDDCIDHAVHAWQCLCPPSSPPSKLCCFQIEYTTDETLFRDPANESAVTRMTRVPGGDCELDCNVTKIYINMTDKYTDYDPLSFPKTPYRRFFSTRDVLLSLDINYEVINLCDVIWHEIGHLFGLAHHDACGRQGVNNRPTEGLMSANGVGINAPPVSFTQDDVCAYRRLYCPDFVTHADISNSLHTPSTVVEENYPNPFTTTTIIPFTIAVPGQVKLLVYNEAGQMIRVLADAYMPAGSYEEKFDSQNLPQGVYWYVVQFNNEVLVRKMLLVR